MLIVPITQDAFFRNKQHRNSHHTVHKLWDIDSVVASFRVGVGQYSGIWKFPSKDVGDDDDECGRRSSIWRLCDVGLEAMESLFAADGRAFVQGACGAIMARHCEL